MFTVTLTKTENRVKISEKISARFEVKEGVRQDAVQPGTRGNYWKSTHQQNGTHIQEKHQCLAYVDDLVIISRSRKGLKEVTRIVEVSAARI